MVELLSTLWLALGEGLVLEVPGGSCARPGLHRHLAWVRRGIHAVHHVAQCRLGVARHDHLSFRVHHHYGLTNSFKLYEHDINEYKQNSENRPTRYIMLDNDDEAKILT